MLSRIHGIPFGTSLGVKKKKEKKKNQTERERDPERSRDSGYRDSGKEGEPGVGRDPERDLGGTETVTEMHRDSETETDKGQKDAKRDTHEEAGTKTAIQGARDTPRGEVFLFNEAVYTWLTSYRLYFLETAWAMVWQLQAYQARSPPQARYVGCTLNAFI